MIRMQKLEALMEAVEGAYFVQSDQVASGRAGPAELSSAATVWRGMNLLTFQRLGSVFFDHFCRRVK